MRTRRVGSITCGSILIIFGVLFLTHMFYPALSLEFIMKLWPMILIMLGGEMIVANLRNKGAEAELLKYDKGAIFITFLMTCFAIGMGITEYCMEYCSGLGMIY
ncbi:MAG: DUF5668 domain-containing protein [Lachnospiraceae bacterium]